MIVMKLTTSDKKIFYNADHSPQLIAETLKRCQNWKRVELIEMSTRKYNAIPTTNEAANLFK